MCDYLESTANCLYGDGCQSEEKVLYTKSQRKCKSTLMGITTFLTIVNVVTDWYNFVFYQNTTQKDIIYTQDAVTDALYWTFLALCCVCSIFMLCELFAFVLQLKDARIYQGPVKRSELFEEIISGCLLLFENFGIPLVFLIGFFMGFCPMTAQIRSFTGRIALVVSGISVIWRMVQSFAFCSRCDPKTDCSMMFCQGLRAIRMFIIVNTSAIIIFLLAISLSLEVGIKVDKYNGRYHGQQYSDIQKQVYLYHRVSVPYFVNKSSDTTQNLYNCSFFETKIEIAKSKDIETIHDVPYFRKIPCEKFSPFFTSFITTQHIPLLSTYNCSVIVSIKNSDFTSARVINAAYELTNSRSRKCVSNSIKLVLDTKYDPTNNYVKETTNIWTNNSIDQLRQSVCSDNQVSDDCDRSNLDTENGYPVFNCNQCVYSYNIQKNEVQTLALVSKLIVSEKEMLSYYPCMPNVNIYDSIDLPVCNAFEFPTNMDHENLVSYTTCLNPYVTNIDTQNDWQQKEEKLLSKTKMN